MQFRPTRLSKEGRISPPHPDEHSGASPSSARTHEETVPPASADSVLFSHSLFEGSPAYKQRRKKTSRSRMQRLHPGGTATTLYDTGDDDSGSDTDGMHISDYSLVPEVEGTPAPAPVYPLFSRSDMDDRRDTSTSRVQSSTLTGNDTPPSVSPPKFASPGLGCEAPYGLRQDPVSWPHGLTSFSPEHPVPHTSPSSDIPLAAPFREHNASQPTDLTANGPIDGQQQHQKGFSCPLLSCGRLFKRLEHLKRHVRTHTQERPYECARCAKRFSRSDNLTQHIKTHEKADRGERMKTEASESTEDEMTTFLEAEVDAMAARESRGNHRSTSLREANAGAPGQAT